MKFCTQKNKEGEINPLLWSAKSQGVPSKKQPNHTNSSKPPGEESQPTAKIYNSTNSNQNPHRKTQQEHRIDELRADYRSRTPVDRSKHRTLTRPNKSKHLFAAGIGNYVGQGLEGADEVPVLAHPELVGFHGDGDSATTASSPLPPGEARERRRRGRHSTSLQRTTWSRLISGGRRRRRVESRRPRNRWGGARRRPLVLHRGRYIGFVTPLQSLLRMEIHLTGGDARSVILFFSFFYFLEVLDWQARYAASVRLIHNIRRLFACCLVQHNII